VSSSWTEASKCPADGAQGVKSGESRGNDGSRLITVICPENRCHYHEMGWIVQIRRDGSIPDPIDPKTREKNYPAVQADIQRSRRIRDNLERQLGVETKPGGEIRTR
jgi:hypothetical protein